MHTPDLTTPHGVEVHELPVSGALVPKALEGQDFVTQLLNHVKDNFFVMLSSGVKTLYVLWAPSLVGRDPRVSPIEN